MSFKDQLRNWLMGSWEDFWRVHPSKLLGVIGTLLFAIVYAAWRICPLYYPRWRDVNLLFSPLVTLFCLAVLGVSLFRRIRKFFRSIR